MLYTCTQYPYGSSGRQRVKTVNVVQECSTKSTTFSNENSHLSTVAQLQWNMLIHCVSRCTYNTCLWSSISSYMKHVQCFTCCYGSMQLSKILVSCHHWNMQLVLLLRCFLGRLLQVVSIHTRPFTMSFSFQWNLVHEWYATICHMTQSNVNVTDSSINDRFQSLSHPLVCI